GNCYGEEGGEIGVRALYKDGWVSAIDSDIFARDIQVEVPAGTTDNSDPLQTPQGFAKTLINSSSNNSNTLGFTFYESNINGNPIVDIGCEFNKMFENDASCNEDYGGFAYSLNHSSDPYDHTSKWLNNFTFAPPSTSDELENLGTSFEKNKIYNISSDIFNSRLGQDDSVLFNYSITGDSNGVPILYVEGDITISAPITTSSLGRLLIVVSGNVIIDSRVGSDTNSFNMSNDPNIMAGIIASGEITFESCCDEITVDNRDMPIMVSAPLISRTNIFLERDLHHDYNAFIPPHSAKAFSKYIYLLASVEREKSQGALYYTGVTTFDLDWEYIY
ncbi:hypothetical protein K0B04_02440, partial [Patescibacteria group bacterium]|nr:hypothetical protein [Patescibacteria group bacterium]